jgi:hypothetical protein
MEKKKNSIIATTNAPHVCMLSDQTLSVLQNFSVFAPYFVSDESDHIRMFVPGAIVIYELGINLLGQQETLPDFAISSIAAFMNSCKAFNPDELSFAFTDKFVQISDNESYLRFLYTPKEILHLPKSYDMPSSIFKGYDKYQASFKITADVMKKLKSVSGYVKLNMLEISMKDGVGTLILRNPDLSFDSLYSHDISGEGTCDINIQVKNLKFIVGDYNVSFDTTRIQFLNNDMPLRYIITQSKILTERKDK